MTPLELLEEVKGRFVVLYHNDDTALQRLLRQALRKYQDKAGYIMDTHLPEGTTEWDLPRGFLSLASCQDQRFRHIPTQIDQLENKLLFKPVSRTGEITVYWLVRLSDWPLDENLPYGCVGLIADYLEALIDISNTSRRRDVYSGIDGPIQELPAVQDLKARLLELEQQMEDNRAVLPAMMVVC